MILDPLSIADAGYLAIEEKPEELLHRILKFFQ